MDIFRQMSFLDDTLDFFKINIGFHFLYIAEGRQLLLLNLCFGVAHDVAQLIDFLADAEGKCLACLACTPCTPNAVYIIFLILRYIIVEYHINIVNVNPSCGNICCNQNFNRAIAEFLHDLITLCLLEVAVQPFCEIAASLQHFH